MIFSVFDEVFQDRFWSFVNRTEECWIWTGTRETSGYGRIEINKRPMRAHRISWLLTKGHLPGHLHVLHHCDNPPCVNPDHLYLGTDLDNARDRMTRGRHRCGEPKGIKNHFAKLTEDEVRLIRRLRRQGHGVKKLAVEFGLHWTHVSNICRRKNWTHLKDE